VCNVADTVKHTNFYPFVGPEEFLGEFAKLWKATISIVMSVRPSIRMEQLGFHWTDFHEIWYLSFPKSVDKIQDSLKPEKNKGYFKWRLMYIYDSISPNSSYNEKCSRQKFYRISKHVLYWITFFSKKCRLWDNVEEYGTAGHVTDENTAHALCMLDN
jgi:hypothetical protein